tara:strand:- start:4078 stop:4491 length:414 start_codon:yes stop_codon:yes gene_type:complete
MKSIIFYDTDGKIHRAVRTVEGTEESMRPAYDTDNSFLIAENVELEQNKMSLAVYDPSTNTVTYNEPTYTNADCLADIRKIRNNRLQKSDWTQAIDSPLSDSKKAEWATYRQALRDLTSQNQAIDNIDDVIFPSMPE